MTENRSFSAHLKHRFFACHRWVLSKRFSNKFLGKIGFFGGDVKKDDEKIEEDEKYGGRVRGTDILIFKF